ncbi:MAG: GAF domain-containing protein [Anaerolineales bacterium]|nr:GAF domain-containing protein [Anaerolineales bacterium]
MEKITNIFLEPSSSDMPIEVRRKARLLSAILLILIVGGLLVSTVYTTLMTPTTFFQDRGFIIGLIAVAAFVVAYQLNRAGHYLPAAIITVSITLLATFVIAYPKVGNNSLALLNYLILSVLLSSMLLTPAITLIFISIGSLGLFVYMMLMPEMWLQIPFVFFLIVSIIIVLAGYHSVQVAKDRQAALEESEARFRTMVESAPVAIVVFDFETLVLTEVNKNTEILFGYRREELLTKSILDISSPIQLNGQKVEDAAQEYVPLALNGDSPVFEWLHVNRKGEELHCEVRLTRFPVNGRQLLHASVVDISEKIASEQKLHQTAERERALREIEQAILAAQSPKEIAVTAVGRLHGIVPSERTTVTLYDPHSPEALVMAEAADGAVVNGDGRRVPLAIINPHGLELAKLHVIGDVLKYEKNALVKDEVLAAGLRAYAIVPMIVHGELIGSINMRSTRPDVFETEHINIAQEVANQTAVALEQARLLAAAEQRAAELEAVQQASLGITNSLALDDVLQSILLAALDIIAGAEIARIFLHRDGELNTHTAIDKNHNLLLDLPEPRLHGLTHSVANQARTIVVSDVSRDELFQGSDKFPFGALIGLPLKIGENVVGVMTVYFVDPKTFEDSEIRTLRLLGDQAAIAIENARLYAQVRSHAADLENRVSARTAELQSSNAELETFAYSVSHDLRAPLRAMEGFAQALLEDYSESLDSLGQNYAQRIVEASRRMDTLIQDLLSYSRLSRADIHIHSLLLANILKEACDLQVNTILERDAEITIKEPVPAVQGHYITLYQVVANLINNAIKFVPEGEQPKVHIWAERNNGTVRLNIQDNGIGIDPDHHTRIFRIFERLHGSTEYPGTGIGLAIVQRGMQRLNGKVGVKSALGQGSTFWIELPEAESET